MSVTERRTAICGIAGIHCWGSARPSIDTVKNLLLVNETRGKDASGVAYIPGDGGDIQIRKDRMPANEFIKTVPDKLWEEISNSPTVLMHTRAKTKGDPHNNENNHPVYYEKTGWLVTHNGNVRNDDDLWKYYKAKRFAEVDTSAIPLVLGQGKNFDESLNHLSLLGGDATVAVWNENNRDWLALARFGTNDLFLFLDMDDGILYWSSALMATHVLPAVGLHKLRFVTMSRLLDERVVKLGPKCEDTVVYKVTRSPFTLPEVKRTHSYTTGGSKGIEILTSKKPAELAKRPDFRFERHDAKDGKFGTRPGPLWDGVTIENLDLFNVVRRFASTTNLVCDTIHTPYGRWVVTRGKDAIITDRKFHASKRIRRYWHSYFNDLESIPYPELPCVIMVDKTPYDNLLAIETMMIEDKAASNGTSTTHILYMCGWCGVMSKPEIWMNKGMRCAWCNIRSHMLLPHEGGN